MFKHYRNLASALIIVFVCIVSIYCYTYWIGREWENDESWKENLVPVEKTKIVIPITEQNDRVIFPEGEEEILRLLDLYGESRNSWHWEELFIREYFQGRQVGYFVDVGAYLWKKGNNTFFLENEFKWHGIAIDAQEQFRTGYEENRPLTKYFCFYVSDRSTGEASLTIPNKDSAQASGVLKYEEEQNNEVVQVKEITLNDLLSSQQIEKIEFMNMDIESAEPAALRGFDIQKYKPELVCIEVKPEIREFIENYFQQNGYKKIELWSKIDTHNNYYIPSSKDFHVQ